MKKRYKHLFFEISTIFFIVGCANNTNSNIHTVIFDSNGGSSVPSQKIEHGEKIVKPDDPIREGYTFNCWTYNNENWSFVGYVVTCDMTLLANWNANSYNLVLNNSNSRYGSVSGSGIYLYDSEVTITATPTSGYSFVGWFDSNNNLVSNQDTYTFKMGLDLELTANWSGNLNNLSVTSDDTSKGTVNIVCGNGYSDESITVVATPSDGCVFRGWYDGLSKVSDEITYTFTMPNYDYSLIGRFWTTNEDNGIEPTISFEENTITYGLYPQTCVDDSSLISALNDLETPELNGWYLYEGKYYAKYAATPRNSAYAFHNGTAIVEGFTYWFKCEPIVWDILSNNDNEFCVVSKFSLDAHCFYHGTSSRTIDKQTIYANNYKFSDIRAWLNEDFYDSAFALGYEHIQTTIVDNSLASTKDNANPYICDDTEDKIFLLSRLDYINMSKRSSINTDWAVARGVLYDYSTQYLGGPPLHHTYIGRTMTRSPYHYKNDTIYNISTNDYILENKTVDETFSVRPAITLKLNG